MIFYLSALFFHKKSILVLGMRIQFKGIILSLIGSCSLEFYMIHGLWIELLRSDWIYLDHAPIYDIAVLVSGGISALLLHKIMTPVLQRMNWGGKDR